jgi:hypothetical protein
MEKPSLARSPNIKEKKQYRESRFLKKSHYIPLRKRVKHEHLNPEPKVSMSTHGLLAVQALSPQQQKEKK